MRDFSEQVCRDSDERGQAAPSGSPSRPVPIGMLPRGAIQDAQSCRRRGWLGKAVSLVPRVVGGVVARGMQRQQFEHAGCGNSVDAADTEHRHGELTASD